MLSLSWPRARRPVRPLSSRTARLRLEQLERRDAPATGLFDGSFTGNGRVAFGFTANQADSAAKVAIQSDGKAVVVGAASNGTDFNFAIARLNVDGTLDTTFDGDGKQTVSFNLGGNNEDRAT